MLQLEALYPYVYKNVHEYGNRYCKGVSHFLSQCIRLCVSDINFFFIRPNIGFFREYLDCIKVQVTMKSSTI